MTRYQWLKQKIDEFKQNPTDECLIWPFTKTRPYVLVPGVNKAWTIQRAAFFYYYEIKAKEDCRINHECSNSTCFNPLHQRKVILFKNEKNNTKRNRRIKARRLSKGLCVYCGKRPHVEGIQRCKACQERDNKRNKEYGYNGIYRDIRLRLKEEVMHYYGNSVCACCGETHLELLTIDHINGGGNEHRKKLFGQLSGGEKFYRWLVKNNYPQGYQVLCFNCNMARAMYGFCPHQQK